MVLNKKCNYCCAPRRSTLPLSLGCEYCGQKSFNISKLVIGMTVIAFGTSSPELIVSINASVSGVPSLALGNLVGSNIANILLILGVSGLIYPIKSENKSLWLDWVVLTFASSLFIIFSLDHNIDFNEGILLLGIFIIFMVYSYLRGSGYLSGDNLGDNNTPSSEVEELSLVPRSCHYGKVHKINKKTFNISICKGKK